MNQVLGIFFSYLIAAHQPVECKELHDYDYHHTYEIPDGLSLVRDGWARGSSNLTVADDYGNSVDLYTGDWKDLDLHVESYGKSRGENLIAQRMVDDKIARYEVHNPGPFDAFNVVFLIEKDNFSLTMYEFLKGDLKTHGVFEEKALELARSIARGDVRDVSQSNDCGYPSLWNLLLFK